ncbi:metal-dependent hydrolase [Paenibacillus sp. J31TS4]|uniref:endonuclease/exonuclease/phosphatase family protein n=1 Tax=Paenibacillus sp. J31TS4 TaxID=2807195 RepID=UPI001B0B2420|nr:endonuclease/exonuclease/phosphatase family protein [Paenibacillus sp. J31TS4]GIP37671.1 metal-dependent hydrolase [Paenibacillus sp. J31TS4]
MWKKSTAILAMAALALTVAFPSIRASANGGPVEGPRGNEVTVKVMSYNIHHGEGTDKVLDLERIAGVIKEAGADIVGLQEVDNHYSSRSGLEDQAARLSELTGMRYVYAANLDLDPPEPGKPRRQYGTAVLSKYPILASENHLLSSFGQEQRGLLETVINVKGNQIRFYNTHLGLTVQQRLAQIEEIKAIASQHGGTKILTGDLNAKPDSAELASLQEDFHDTYADRNEDYTFPSTGPTSRIDYILTSADTGIGERQVLQTPASDHLPITTELILKRTAPFENGAGK